MAYFPFMIQLDDKQCLIVGGGAVAARKAAQMCEFGACVTVVAPEICAELLAIADTERIDETAGIVENIDGNCQKKPERIRVWKREVTEADISGMDVVIMATDDAELNSQYAELCRSKHILVNVVDVKKDCDFYFPAIIKQGEVVVSVSTGGNSPMLASKIKKDIRQTLRTDYGQIADELGAIREKILAEEPDERARKRRFAAIVEAKMQEQRIRIGTRGSRLAQIQTDMVIEQLKKHYPDVRFEKVIVTTKGDKQKEAAISSFGGKAVFVEEIEEALLDGTIDLAVHSAKDMPNPCKKGLGIAGVLPRACVQDVLIYRADTDIRSKNTFTVGTGSLRRRSQIKEIYPQAECMELRGNVTTRIQKLRDGLYDAIILAAAGIERLGIEKEPDLVYEYLDVDAMLPAAGQGIIAMEACEGTLPYHMAETISDAETEGCLRAERAVVREMEAGCHEPIGVYATWKDDKTMQVRVMNARSGKVEREMWEREKEDANDLE